MPSSARRTISRALFPLAIAGGACAGGAPTGDATVLSASGALQVHVRSAVQPPVRGTMSADLTVTDARTDAPVDDLGVSVEPWMPSMNHGASVVPTVTPEGSGRYRIDDLVLFMPGLWELRLTFTGSRHDQADPAFDIP